MELVGSVKRQFLQRVFGHHVQTRVVIDEYLGHDVVHAFDRHMQSPVMSSPLGRDFLFSEGEVVVGCDVIDESPKSFYKDVLGYMSFIQDFY